MKKKNFTTLVDKKDDKSGAVKRLIGLGLIVLGCFLVYKNYNSAVSKLKDIFDKKPTTQEVVNKDIQLPEGGWILVKKNEGQIIIKSEKKVENEIHPTFLLAQSPVDTDLPNDVYVEVLKRGVKATLPSMKYEATQVTTDMGWKIFSTKGSYLNSKKSIQVMQKMFNKDNSWYTYTISFLDGQVSKEEITFIENQVQNWVVLQ